jgi:cytochrome c551/c552/glucose/arabinose dehydrogenase
MKKYTAFVLLFTLALGAFAQTKPTPKKEQDYYEIKTLPIPKEIYLEVGGLATMPDGRLAVSTRRGEIWIVENPYQKSSHQTYYRRFASGLHEVLGLAYKDGAFYCSQRGELTKISDTDRDGVADLYEPIYQFDISGNYHEYTYGPVFDKNGDMWVSLNLAWVGFGEGKFAKWRGWFVKISPDGKMEPFAGGLRSPAGYSFNDEGDLFYGENQGDWVGSGRVTHLAKGEFAGNPGGLKWAKEPNSPLKLSLEEIQDNGSPMFEAAKKNPKIKLPAVWFPHAIMGISTSDILQDTTKGKFSPFPGQYFVADQGQSKVMRMGLEKVNGVYQGFAINYREGFQSGILRERFGLDGSMFVGMTSRGWGSTGKDDFGLQRLFWNGNMPFEIDMIKAKSDGFEFSFTQPVDVNSVKKAASYAIRSYIYKYQHQYGSPIIELKNLKIKGVEVSADHKKVRISIDGIRQFFIHEFILKGVLNEKGDPLLHETAYYTLNQIPAGPALVAAAPQDEIFTKVTEVRVVKNSMGYELGIAGLLKKHTCSACHAKDSKLIGPAFTEIAKRNYSNQKILELVYKPNPQNWPDYATEMAPMSHVPKADVLKIAGWINGLRETEGLKNRD